jgi:isopenicillin N synthase-like dioxygenase
MLWHLTGGVYKSGLHRVVCEPNKDRFSCPFFGHRIDSASIAPLKKFRGLYDPKKFPWDNEGEFLRHRLEEINLKN